MEITLEEIQRKFENLPEDLKWAIMAANVDDNIIEIGQKEGLNVEQMGQLSLETHMVMFGFTHPDKFEDSVKASLKLGDEKTRAVVNAINDKILKEIRIKMIEAFGGISKEEEEKLNKEKEHDEKILHGAGIEIIGNQSVQTEKLELPTKEGSSSILTQKLSGSSQNQITKTEYTLDNITKKPNTPIINPPHIAPSNVIREIKPASVEEKSLSPSYAKGMDPYRVKPE